MTEHGGHGHHEVIPDTTEKLPISVGVSSPFIDNEPALMQERLHLPQYRETQSYGLVDTAVAGGAARLATEAVRGVWHQAPWLAPGVPLVTLKRDLDRVRDSEQRDREGRIHRGLLLPYFRDRATVPAPNWFKYMGKAWDTWTHSKGQRWYQRAEAAAKGVGIAVGSSILWPFAAAGWAAKFIPNRVIEAATDPHYSRETKIYFNTIRRLEHTTDMREKQLKKKHGLEKLALSNTIVHLAGGANDQGKIAEASAKVADSAVKGFYLAHGDRSGFQHGQYFDLQKLAADTAVANLNLLKNQIRTMREELPGLREQLRVRGGTMSPTERTALQNKINDFETKLTTYPGAYARTKEIIDHTVPSVGERNARLAVILPAHFVGSIASAALGYWATGIIHRMIVNPNDRGRELQEMVNNRVRDARNLAAQHHIIPADHSAPTVLPHHAGAPQIHAPVTAQPEAVQAQPQPPVAAQDHLDSPISPPSVPAVAAEANPLGLPYLHQPPPVDKLNGHPLKTQWDIKQASPFEDMGGNIKLYPHLEWLKKHSWVRTGENPNLSFTVRDVTNEATIDNPQLQSRNPHDMAIWSTGSGNKELTAHSGAMRLNVNGRDILIPSPNDGIRAYAEGGGWQADGSYVNALQSTTEEETLRRLNSPPFVGHRVKILGQEYEIVGGQWYSHEEAMRPITEKKLDTMYWQLLGDPKKPGNEDLLGIRLCSWQRTWQPDIEGVDPYSYNQIIIQLKPVNVARSSVLPFQGQTEGTLQRMSFVPTRDNIRSLEEFRRKKNRIPGFDDDEEDTLAA